jgi:hypothetical protein
MSLYDIELDCMDKYGKYQIEQFATDSKFISWVNSPNNENKEFWNAVIEQFPHQKDKVNEAVSLITAARAVEPEISEDKLLIIWNKISESHNKKIQHYQFLRWVAVFFLVLGMSILLPRIFESPEYNFVETDFNQIEDAKVILSDGSIKSINIEKSEIKAFSSGQIVVNNDTIRNISEKKTKEDLIKVVMPYGKQTSLQLPDGTTVYINAGSELLFPEKFTNSNRKVYLIGEAFFDVVENKEQPFIVHTKDIDITVTGTTFNVSAYNDNDFIQTVLVSGAINVNKNTLFGRSVNVKPGESVLFNREENSINTSMVETDHYTSWIYGYIICKNISIKDLARKIERYYNYKIEFTRDVSEITFSGKLDFKQDIEDVLNTVAFASSLKLEIKDNKVLIKD